MIAGAKSLDFSVKGNWAAVRYCSSSELWDLNLQIMKLATSGHLHPETISSDGQLNAICNSPETKTGVWNWKPSGSEQFTGKHMLLDLNQSGLKVFPSINWIQRCRHTNTYPG
jgi:hypothetical protein